MAPLFSISAQKPESENRGVIAAVVPLTTEYRMVTTMAFRWNSGRQVQLTSPGRGRTFPGPECLVSDIVLAENTALGGAGCSTCINDTGDISRL